MKTPIGTTAGTSLIGGLVGTRNAELIYRGKLSKN